MGLNTELLAFYEGRGTDNKGTPLRLGHPVCREIPAVGHGSHPRLLDERPQNVTSHA